MPVARGKDRLPIELLTKELQAAQTAYEATTERCEIANLVGQPVTEEIRAQGEACENYRQAFKAFNEFILKAANTPERLIDKGWGQ
jgi:hypothetical protein